MEAVIRFYLARHAQAEEGEQLDPTRTLTAIGEKQVKWMSRFLQSQTDKIKLVIHSDLKRGIDTAEPIAKDLDVPTLQTPLVGPDGEVMKVWKLLVGQQRNLKPDDEILIVSHGPFINSFAAWLLMSAEGDKFHWSHASIGHFDTDTPEDGTYHYAGRKRGQPSFMHWMVTAKLLKRFDKDDSDAVIKEQIALAALDVIEEALTEAAGEYTYDEIEQKRWVLGPGGISGENCEHCQENADEGWVDMDGIYTSPDGYVDGPPGHLHCECELEYRTKRVRVPVTA